MASPAVVSVTAVRDTGSVAINNIQSFFFNRGRRTLSDAYRSCSATLAGRVPSALPTLTIGDIVTVTVTAKAGATSQSLAYNFRVANIQIDYGLVDTMDTWAIQLEDAFALLGRAAIDLTTTAGTLTTTAANNVCDEVPQVTFFAPGTATTTTVKATTFENANALDAFQTYANTEFAFVIANGDDIRWFARNVWVNSSQNVTFADDGTGDLEYQTLTFDSLADAVADKTVVMVRDGAEYTAGTGSLAYELQTYTETAADAQSLAEYLIAVFDSNEPRPFELSYLLTGQDTDHVLDCVDGNYPVQATITFRGSVVNAFVLGFALSVTTELSRCTLFLLPSQSAQFLVLDDASFGKLDENKLGW